jgi:hypothetical protein
MQPARDFSRLLTRERGAQRIGRAARGARREQPPERRFARADFILQLAPPRLERALRLARFLRFALEAPQRAVGVRDRGLRGAQRLARLAPVGLLALQRGPERRDPRAQRGEVFFPGGGGRRWRGDQQRDSERPDQAFALPCADTAAMRRATSPASPR